MAGDASRLLITVDTRGEMVIEPTGPIFGDDNPQALGEVDAAQEFASALATFVGTHGDDLRHGSSWVAESASNL